MIKINYECSLWRYTWVTGSMFKLQIFLINWDKGNNVLIEQLLKQAFTGLGYQN